MDWLTLVGRGDEDRMQSAVATSAGDWSLGFGHGAAKTHTTHVSASHLVRLSRLLLLLLLVLAQTARPGQPLPAQVKHGPCRSKSVSCLCRVTRHAGGERQGGRLPPRRRRRRATTTRRDTGIGGRLARLPQRCDVMGCVVG